MAFKGLTVYLSRNLVALEYFDALHDALKLNGANICFCADPSANSSNHYHVISSLDHEKFADLSAKGCNLIGPECILRCAKEHRAFPKQGYTCCLAMDGVKVLASGFEKEEKLNIEKIVTAMSGELHGKTSLDINFVVAKDVLAAKYKWALNVLRKPIVTIDWLHQCWHEHRLVPHKSYGMPPFTGLIISATRIPPDERKEMEELVMKYGGQYFADLTKKCTHLISNTAEGDKYKVAKRWGHIKIVNQMWISQSIAARACLDEDSYPVQATNTVMLANKGIPKSHNQEKEIVSLTMAANLQSSISQHLSSTPSVSPASTKEQAETVVFSAENTSEWAGCIAADSQNEDNDLYLINCRIILAGFQPVEMRKLVSMVRSGGGSRYMSFSEKLTHIIVGKPSEKVDARQTKHYFPQDILHYLGAYTLDGSPTFSAKNAITSDGSDILSIRYLYVPGIRASRLPKPFLIQGTLSALDKDLLVSSFKPGNLFKLLQSSYFQDFIGYPFKPIIDHPFRPFSGCF